MNIQQAISRLTRAQDLSEEDAYAVMTAIMNGECTPAQIGGYLVGLASKGETSAEIAGSARAMREHAITAPHHAGAPLVDTCGTGGDHSGTFNISTTVAFVVAGCGVPVAKHGNRSVTSKCGSADVLKALGANLDLTPEQVGRCIDDVGIGFLYAVHHHPAMKHAIGPRRELGVRTIFNILGPLTNPAGATHQVLGVFDPSLTEMLADVLRRLGTTAAFVVHGAGGLDELSTTGVNRVSH
ncbi:MAG: anthranilate phosphoribosyltransferase, partial [Caldilineae bacterium]